MYRIRRDELPFKGSSHNFVGADNGGVDVSVFLFNGEPGRGGPPWPGPSSAPVR